MSMGKISRNSMFMPMKSLLVLSWQVENAAELRPKRMRMKSHFQIHLHQKENTKYFFFFWFYFFFFLLSGKVKISAELRPKRMRMKSHFQIHLHQKENILFASIRLTVRRILILMCRSEQSFQFTGE